MAYGSDTGDRARSAIGLGVAITVHLVLIALFLTWTNQARRGIERQTVVVMVTPPKPTLVEPPPPKVVLPDIQVPVVAPPAIPDANNPAQPPERKSNDQGPPVHFFAGVGSAPQGLTASSGVGAYAPRAPSDYGDQVAARVNGAGTGAASGPKTNQDCLINYQITIDKRGNLLSYKIEPCTSALVNATAEARIKAAAPYPPPPDTGATTYTIYRSQVFHYDPALGKPAK